MAAATTGEARRPGRGDATDTTATAAAAATDDVVVEAGEDDRSGASTRGAPLPMVTNPPLIDDEEKDDEGGRGLAERLQDPAVPLRALPRLRGDCSAPGDADESTNAPEEEEATMVAAVTDPFRPRGFETGGSTEGVDGVVLAGDEDGGRDTDEERSKFRGESGEGEGEGECEEANGAASMDSLMPAAVAAEGAAGGAWNVGVRERAANPISVASGGTRLTDRVELVEESEEEEEEEEEDAATGVMDDVGLAGLARLPPVPRRVWSGTRV